MYIQPQSNFKVFRNVPWNNAYKDTRYFRNQSQQQSFFASKQKYTFSDFTYVRQTGAVRVPTNAENLFDCNYCAFQNSGFGNKWFYAFITGLEYINNEVTELVFEIDLLQTWLFDFSLGMCYVEREHVADDTVGLHTVQENLPIGDIVEHMLNEITATPICTLSVIEEGQTGRFLDNIYTPTLYVSGDAASINQYISAYDDQPEKVASLHMSMGEGTSTISVTAYSQTYSHRGASYTPVNKKLFCYPYNFLTVDDYGGNSEMYHFEDFNQASIQFKFKGGQGGGSGAPYALMIPLNYKGISEAMNYALLKNDFPKCAYTIDNFRAWAASQGQKALNNLENSIQNQAIMNVSGAISSLAGGVGSAASAAMTAKTPAQAQAGIVGSAISATAGLFNNAVSADIAANNLQTQAENLQIDVEYQKIHGKSIGGSFGSGSATWQYGKIGFQFIQHHIKPEYAKIIDDFFTRFGYKVLENKVPNVTSRTNFNYLKTIECEVHGNIPNYANAGLQKIFNAGVTLWHTDTIGDYSSNPIAS